MRVEPLRLSMFSLAIAAFLWPGLALAEDRLVPFAQETAKGEHWGYKDAAGVVVIPPKFILAREFSAEGLAAVANEDEWLLIDRRGRVLVRPFVTDNGPDPFREGRARFVSDGKFGFFDAFGRVVIPPRFDFAKPFANGLAAVCRGCKLMRKGEHTTVSGGTWGHIDTAGNRVD